MPVSIKAALQLQPSCILRFQENPQIFPLYLNYLNTHRDVHLPFLQWRPRPYRHIILEGDKQNVIVGDRPREHQNPESIVSASLMALSVDEMFVCATAFLHNGMHRHRDLHSIFRRKIVFRTA